jgi:hypothetical protein
MRRKLAVLLLGIATAAAPAHGLDYVGLDGGFASPLGKTGDFTNDGTGLELRWRHHNRGRSAWELVAGYTQMGLEGEIQDTIARYAQLMREKNQLAQLQGGPGNGFIIAEYGIFEAFYGGANLLFHPLGNPQRTRFAPFLSVGAGLYNWRVPFRMEWLRSPFFGEQNAYDPPAEGGLYAGVQQPQEVDFTKHHTSGGLNAGIGTTMRLTRRLQLDLQARTHLLFSTGRGDREEGIDDQDYLENLSFVLLNGGLNWRF